MSAYNKHNKICRIVAGMYLVASLAACSGGDGDKMHSHNHDFDTTPLPKAVIGVSVSAIENNLFFKNMYRTFEDVANKNPQTTVLLNHAQNNQDTQNNQLEQMLGKGAKTLVVNLVDSEQGAQIVKKMCGRSVPVVYLDRSPGDKNMASCNSSYLVEGDSAQAGMLQGKQVLLDWKANPKWDKNGDGIIQYGMLEGIPGLENVKARTQWSVGTMESYPKLSVPVQKLFQEPAMFSDTVAEQVVSEWLKKPEFAQLEVILANNDTMALGAVRVLKANNIKLPVYGIDGSPEALRAMKSGDLAGTVFNDYDKQVRAASRMAVNLAVGQPVLEGLSYNMEYQVVKVPYAEINNSNIDHFLNLGN